MARKRNTTPIPDGLDLSTEEVKRRLIERIAYHRNLIAREQKRRALPWYKRIFTA